MISAGCSRYWYTTSEMSRRGVCKLNMNAYFHTSYDKRAYTQTMTTDVPDYASCTDVPPSECKLRIAPADLSSRNVRSRQGRIGCASFCCCMWSVAGKASSRNIPPRIVALLEINASKNFELYSCDVNLETRTWKFQAIGSTTPVVFPSWQHPTKPLETNTTPPLAVAEVDRIKDPSARLVEGRAI